MIDISMPRLSDSMEEGTILKWLAAEGAQIKRGDELAEIETDKASMVYEADQEGSLHILAGEGDTLPVGAPIAQLLAVGEQPSQAGSADTGTAAPEPAAEQASVESAPVPQAAAVSAVAEVDNAVGARVKASPLARRLAAGAGIELTALAGSGPGGRVVKADVERALQAGAAPAVVSAGGPAATPFAPPKGEVELVELSRTQSLIARRMAEAKATIPEFTLQCEIDMEAAVALRTQLKGLAERQERQVPSFNDMVLKACALALREYPRANGTYKDGRFELHPRVNVGVAVAAADALLVPVVRDADTSSLWSIAAESRRLALAARDGTITPPDLAGGTFSVSNLGMFGIDAFTAVINPPQAAILAVGSLAQRAVVRDGQLVARHTMTVTLTCDHRILYGADAAEFLGSIRELLEQPLALMG
ncbi:MAG TPA: dihydrolipoamide acetyltransferase family protein [Solirubrobacteraceae bacterium]|jgi:pyruvate dehydrogenase E2 component (dihydrolipoamide acetyltransferase)|nr:dihydrolipoamide acetyltransferase family protein [Solirubrobacteraceae bacterium]